jgi:hypothetical protein
MRSILVLATVWGAALAAASGRLAGQPVTPPLNPPAPSYYTCNTVGNGTICTGNPPVESFGPFDTAIEGIPIVCGSGAGAFDVFDQATDQVSARRVYDADGNLVRRVLTDDYTFGEFSNPLTGAIVPYGQSDIRTDVLAVPGDLGSATETTTWNIHYHAAGDGAPVFMHTGRTITAPDGTIEFRAGQLDFLNVFVDGDTTLLDPICTALGA